MCGLFEWKWLSFAIQLSSGGWWKPIIRFNLATNVHILFLNVFYGRTLPTTEFIENIFVTEFLLNSNTPVSIIDFVNL